MKIKTRIRSWFFSSLNLKPVLCALFVALTLFSAQAVAQCTADAGTLAGFKPSDCLIPNGTLIGGIPSGNAVVPAGFQTIFVLTEGPNLVIQQADPSPIFTVTAFGDYTVHTLVFDPATLDLSTIVFGTTTGFDVNGLLIQGGGSICASLDVVGTSILVANPDAGALTATNASVCLMNGTAQLAATQSIPVDAPAGYVAGYVLTSGTGLVIQGVGATPDFTVSDTGLYTIHTLVYDTNTLNLSVVQLGVTTGFDVNGLLIQGGGGICAALDVAGASFVVSDCPMSCTVDAGTITADANTCCLDSSSVVVSATPDGNAVVPMGYQTVYVLTQGSGLVIQQAGAMPSFTVSDTGSYIIHTLVFDPATLDLSIVVPGTTTGFDVNGLLIQGGGSICASLDVAGAPFTVMDCPMSCTVDAGTITADANTYCLDSSSVVVNATPDGNAVVPMGYQTVYVLTQGSGLVIQQAGAMPSFTVADTGSYIIHTLVFDPATLDLSIVVPGTTTGFDVNGLLIQGGGSICASLDVAGAPFTVTDCPMSCTVDAGTITADMNIYCFDANGVVVSATPDSNAVVPTGYQTVFVLTQGAGLIIQQAGAMPSFTVADSGSYIIHTLVFDPATLDLSIVVPGTTTGFDVNSLLIQGGGSICASLDVTGAPFTVVDCSGLCLVQAGTMTPDNPNACFSDTSGVTILGTPDGNAFVPPGFVTTYVLTQGPGLVIQQASLSPDFTVVDTGLFTIHTLVFNPLTLDLSIVQAGVTTGFDVNSLLIQGGGMICASLDVAGAAFNVSECGAVSTGTEEAAWYEGQLVAWPNPVADIVSVDVQHLPEGNYTISVLSIEGSTSKAGISLNQDGVQETTNLNLGDLEPGSYLISISGGKGTQTSRIQVIR